MKPDVKICLGAYALGYRYISKSNSGSVVFHCLVPRFNEIAEAYTSDGAYTSLNAIVGGMCDAEPLFFRMPTHCFYSLQEYILSDGDYDVLSRIYGGF